MNTYIKANRQIYWVCIFILVIISILNIFMAMHFFKIKTFMDSQRDAITELSQTNSNLKTYVDELEIKSDSFYLLNKLYLHKLDSALSIIESNPPPSVNIPNKKDQSSSNLKLFMTFDLNRLAERGLVVGRLNIENKSDSIRKLRIIYGQILQSPDLNSVQLAFSDSKTWRGSPAKPETDDRPYWNIEIPANSTITDQVFLRCLSGDAKQLLNSIIQLRKYLQLERRYRIIFTGKLVDRNVLR